MFLSIVVSNSLTPMTIRGHANTNDDGVRCENTCINWHCSNSFSALSILKVVVIIARLSLVTVFSS